MTKLYQAAAGGNGMPKAKGNETEPPTDPGERGGMPMDGEGAYVEKGGEAMQDALDWIDKG
eukprot:8828898-Alexandrium_andersonii.AAC.1